MWRITSTLAFLLLLLPIPGHSQDRPSAKENTPYTDETYIIPPEVVQLEDVEIKDDVKLITVGNDKIHYLLFCSLKASAGCTTPAENKNYFLIDGNTHFKMPGASAFLTLAFIQDFTIKYNKGKNVGLVPEQSGGPGELGLYILEATHEESSGGYFQTTIVQDGPIIYGTGLSDTDRHKAWEKFFYKVVALDLQQQGKDDLSSRLAKRCMPGADYCTMSIDANFVGIGGMQEPRKVLVMIAVDPHDSHKQLSRTVCTYPAMAGPVCRDWDTGKLMNPDDRYWRRVESR